MVWVWLRVNGHSRDCCHSQEEQAETRALVELEAVVVEQVCWQRLRDRQMAPSLVVCHVGVEQATSLDSVSGYLY